LKPGFYPLEKINFGIPLDKNPVGGDLGRRDLLTFVKGWMTREEQAAQEPVGPIGSFKIGTRAYHHHTGTYAAQHKLQERKVIAGLTGEEDLPSFKVSSVENVREEILARARLLPKLFAVYRSLRHAKDLFAAQIKSDKFWAGGFKEALYGLPSGEHSLCDW